MKDTRAKKEEKQWKVLKRDTKRLSRKIALFAFRVKTFIFLSNIVKLFKMVILLYPTKVYGSLDEVSFTKFYKATKGDLKLLIISGYNLRKAYKCLQKLTNEKIARFGLNNQIKKALIMEIELELANYEAIKDAKKENRFERMKENYSKFKVSEEGTLDKIAEELGKFFNKPFDLDKMSASSVFQSYEIMRNGNKQ